MSILGWIILGLIAGYIASKIVNRQGEGIVLDIVLGIIGGMVGGWLFERFGGMGINGFNLCSMFVAVIGQSSCWSSTTSYDELPRGDAASYQQV